MLNMCRELGFVVKSDATDHTLCDVTLELAEVRARGFHRQSG